MPKYNIQYRLLCRYGTIHILCKHIFRIFGPAYARMFLVLRISKNWHFLPLPPTSAYVIYEWYLMESILSSVFKGCP